MSFFSKITGMAFCWIGVGVVYPCSLMAFKIGADKPSESNVMSLIVFPLYICFYNSIIYGNCGYNFKNTFIGRIMPADTISIKPNNHRIYECPNDKKIELLNKLIQENSSADILVMCSNNPEMIKENLQNKDVRVVEDKQLIKEKDLACEYLISYDMPIKAIVYMARVSKASQKAVMLLDESEQKALHAIETLLGRAIKQERIEGFQYPQKESNDSDAPKRKKLSKDEIKEVAKKRYESSTQEKPKFDKPKRDFRNDDKKDDKWAKKKKAPNKFLGKDENGKAIFSGKSGERNHRHDGTPRGKYDAPKVTGKKINIKARKPKED